MSFEPVARPLFLANTGFYLIEIDPAGKTSSSDGVHSDKADALKAYKLWKGLGFIKPGCTYRIIQVEEVDLEAASKQPVNESALASCVTMLNHAKP